MKKKKSQVQIHFKKIFGHLLSEELSSLVATEWYFLFCFDLWFDSRLSLLQKKKKMKNEKNERGTFCCFSAPASGGTV
jgi:hypothetical protein